MKGGAFAGCPFLLPGTLLAHALITLYPTP